MFGGAGLGYEGTFTASNGPASGMLSVDIGVFESSTEAVGRSLQLAGSGSTYLRTNLLLGSWTVAQTNIPGSGQTLSINVTNELPALYYRPKVSLP